MRLTQQEQKVICDSINKVDPEARILLFGSRVDDQARGETLIYWCCRSGLVLMISGRSGVKYWIVLAGKSSI